MNPIANHNPAPILSKPINVITPQYLISQASQTLSSQIYNRYQTFKQKIPQMKRQLGAMSIAAGVETALLGLKHQFIPETMQLNLVTKYLENETNANNIRNFVLGHEAFREISTQLDLLDVSMANLINSAVVATALATVGVGITSLHYYLNKPTADQTTPKQTLSSLGLKSSLQLFLSGSKMLLSHVCSVAKLGLTNITHLYIPTLVLMHFNAINAMDDVVGQAIVTIITTILCYALLKEKWHVRSID